MKRTRLEQPKRVRIKQPAPQTRKRVRIGSPAPAELDQSQNEPQGLVRHFKTWENLTVKQQADAKRYGIVSKGPKDHRWWKVNLETKELVDEPPETWPPF